MRNTVLLVSLLVVGCSSRSDQAIGVRESAIADSLNNRGIDALQEFRFGNADTVALKGALSDFQRATRIDSTNTTYASNVTVALLALGDEEAALRELKGMVRRFPTDAEGMELIGFLYDLQDNPEVATEWYVQAVAAYDQRLTESNDPNTLIARAIAISFARNREAGLAALADVEEGVEGRNLAECMIRYATSHAMAEVFLLPPSQQSDEAEMVQSQLDMCLTSGEV